MLAFPASAAAPPVPTPPPPSSRMHCTLKNSGKPSNTTGSRVGRLPYGALGRGMLGARQRVEQTTARPLFNFPSAGWLRHPHTGYVPSVAPQYSESLGTVMLARCARFLGFHPAMQMALKRAVWKTSAYCVVPEPRGPPEGSTVAPGASAPALAACCASPRRSPQGATPRGGVHWCGAAPRGSTA